MKESKERIEKTVWRRKMDTCFGEITNVFGVYVTRSLSSVVFRF